ncbi:hypothetical protein NIES23_12280 [Trichormus variabilis NIES-23]|uniref:Uncharacterized protein n=1 Tax=Trichormus variabilis NIES-23 TaxID=1973479 RepID=A0A1Z4KHK0_ANAVA|nr:hypothetical protein NIES23_12280 [Trichormus variabilis NIES-23]
MKLKRNYTDINLALKIRLINSNDVALLSNNSARIFTSIKTP